MQTVPTTLDQDTEEVMAVDTIATQDQLAPVMDMDIYQEAHTSQHPMDHHNPLIPHTI